MEISATGFTAKDLVPHRPTVDQELTRRAMEKDEAVQKRKEPPAAKPVEKADPEKQRRIDIYV